MSGILKNYAYFHVLTWKMSLLNGISDDKYVELSQNRFYRICILKRHLIMAYLWKIIGRAKFNLAILNQAGTSESGNPLKTHMLEPENTHAGWSSLPPMPNLKKLPWGCCSVSLYTLVMVKELKSELLDIVLVVGFKVGFSFGERGSQRNRNIKRLK